MKKLILIFCMVFLLPQMAAQAHQERHLHSQWIKQHISQLHRTMQQMQQRINRLEGRSGSSKQSQQPASKGALNEACGPNQSQLCQKSCAAGWKIEKAICIGRGTIGKTYHKNGSVSCYCFSQNDPYCTIQGVTATCVKQ